METKTTPKIAPTAIQSASVDINRALEILALDPIQATKLLNRAINNINFSIEFARFTQLVTVPDYLFVDPDHPIFQPKN